MAFTESDIQQIQSLERGAPAAEPQSTPSTPPAADPAPQSATNGNGSPPAPAAPPVKDNQSNPNAPAPNTSATSQDDEYGYIDLEELGYEDIDVVQDRLKRFPELERQLNELNEYKNGPKFASDRQKYLYDFASKFEGMEFAAAKQLLDIVDLDLKSLPDQQARFEAFKLNPANKGLSQEEIRDLFIDEETLKFGSSQDPATPQTVAQKAREKQATFLAKEQLAKMQQEWNATRTAVPTPEQLAAERLEYQQFVNEQIANFDGIQVKLSAQNDKGEKLEGALNYKLTSENQKRAVSEALRDPAGWWDRKLEEQGIMREGEQMPDFVKFAELVTWIDHRDQLLNRSYQQGREDQKADLLKNARNIGNPGSSAGAPPAQERQLSEKQEAMKEAMKVAGIIP